MSEKTLASVSFSIKKKEPIKVVKKNTLEQTTKKSSDTSTQKLQEEVSDIDCEVTNPIQVSKESEEEFAKKLEQ